MVCTILEVAIMIAGHIFIRGHYDIVGTAESRMTLVLRFPKFVRQLRTHELHYKGGLVI